MAEDVLPAAGSVMTLTQSRARPPRETSPGRLCGEGGAGVEGGAGGGLRAGFTPPVTTGN